MSLITRTCMAELVGRRKERRSKLACQHAEHDSAQAATLVCTEKVVTDQIASSMQQLDVQREVGTKVATDLRHPACSKVACCTEPCAVCN